MANETQGPQNQTPGIDLSQFWSSHLGLTLVTLSLTVLVFVITPLREAGLPGRLFFDLVVVTLMIFGTLAIDHTRMAKALAIGIVVVCAAVLGAGARPSDTGSSSMGQRFGDRHAAALCPDCVARDVPKRARDLGPHTGGILRLSADWNVVGVGVSVS